MGLALKIIFWCVAWYAIGVAAMQYIKYFWNEDIENANQDITSREVFVLGLLGLGVIIFIIIAEMHYRLTGKR